MIVCERQDRLLCGRHALRALLQNLEIFDDAYLSSLAEQLTTKELIIMINQSSLKGIHSNNRDGYYHTDVIQRALQQQFNIDLMQINTLNEESYSHRNLIRSHIHGVQALFIHQVPYMYLYPQTYLKWTLFH
ncbi:hypothetical protein ES708_09558 [subsurface metagenome]